MKIYLMTDLEGPAGVLDRANWCLFGGRYYDSAKELLTLEVNAAVEGFLSAGDAEIVVADGHGHGGLDPFRLDPRARLMRGWHGWPLLLDDSYDAVAWVGQHAKACTPYAHIAHTQSHNYVDLSINGISIGEFGQFALCAAELGIPCIFGSGDKAFTEEARSLSPGIETVWVKEGTSPVTGEELTFNEYIGSHLGAIHLSPSRARELIRESAARAMQRLQRGEFERIELPKPPYEAVHVLRADDDNPRRVGRATHPSSIAALMNTPPKYRNLD